MPEVIWKWSLAVACLSGAAWLKWCSGVKHDGHRQDDSSGSGMGGVLGVDRDAGRRTDHAMKGRDAADNGKIVNLQDYRNRRAVREWAISSGFGVRNPEVKR